MRGDAILANNKKRNNAMTIGVAIGVVIGVVPGLFTDNVVIGIAIVIGMGIAVLKKE
ncbi:septum formation initiator [Bacillus toyonensis]|uniref:septum formation initiator n=1 Tax=Bacillus toyonensis TaxID=155322 RepID=UPI00259D445D|nr:septum formation initiator [Bacillus toyonensis]MDM5258831.1 septum formation initiator [Bacillus toyonensis]